MVEERRSPKGFEGGGKGDQSGSATHDNAIRREMQ